MVESARKRKRVTSPSNNTPDGTAVGVAVENADVSTHEMGSDEGDHAFQDLMANNDDLREEISRQQDLCAQQQEQIRLLTIERDLISAQYGYVSTQILEKDNVYDYQKLEQRLKAQDEEHVDLRVKFEDLQSRKHKEYSDLELENEQMRGYGAKKMRSMTSWVASITAY